MTIEEVLAFGEIQIFDRKSIHIEPRLLAVTIVALQMQMAVRLPLAFRIRPEG